MLCFGGVGQSVGGNADKVMADDVGEKRQRLVAMVSRRKYTYAFFAQLNMIAECDCKVWCVCIGGLCYGLQTQEIPPPTTSSRLPFLEGMIGDAQPPAAANLKL